MCVGVWVWVGVWVCVLCGVCVCVCVCVVVVVVTHSNIRANCDSGVCKGCPAGGVIEKMRLSTTGGALSGGK